MKTRSIIYLFIVLVTVDPFISFISVQYFHIGASNLFDFFTFLVFAVFILDVVSNRKRIQYPKYLSFFIIFVLFTIFSDHFIASKTLSLKYIYSNKLISTALILVLIENTYFTKSYIKNLTKIIYIVLSIAFVTILIQKLFSVYFFVNTSRENIVGYMDTRYAYQQRLPSIYSWGGSLGIGFSFLPMFAIIIEDVLKKENRFMLFFWILIGLTTAFLNKSRWVIVNYFVILMIPYVYYKRSLNKIVSFLFIIAFSIVIFLSFSDFVGFDITDTINNRILEESSGGLTEGSASTRILAVYVFEKLFPLNPILGKGALYTNDVGTNKDIALARELAGRSSQIHVGYLSLLYTYGVVGGLFYLLFLFYLLKRLYVISKQTSEWAPFIGVLGFAIANLTLVTFSLFYSGLIVCLVYYKHYRDNFYNETNKINGITY